MTSIARFLEEGKNRPDWIRKHQWLRRIRKVVLISAISLLVIMCAFVWQRGWFPIIADIAQLNFEAVLQDTGVYVKSIEIANLKNADTQQIKNLLGIHRYDNIVTLDLQKARIRVEEHGWVDTASIFRIWPDTIRVEIVERYPVARWYDDTALRLVDAQGHVIGNDNNQKFGDLLILSGNNVLWRNEEIRTLLRDLPKIASRVFIAHLVDDRRWDLILNNDLRIMLPHSVTKGQLLNLQRFFDDYAIWDMSKIIVDMRIPSRIVLRSDETEGALIDKVSHAPRTLSMNNINLGCTNLETACIKG